VNIRSKAKEESEILGKLYHNSAATILEKTGDWYKIKSGSVTGYIKAEFLITGTKAEELAKTIGTRIARVNTDTLKVRKSANLEAPVITLLSLGEEFTVKKKADDWIKISVEDTVGFISADYVEVRTEFEEAISMEEEQERLVEEEAASIENERARLAEVAAREAREQTEEISSFRLDNSSSNSSNNSGKTTNIAKTDSSKSPDNNTAKAKASNSSSIRDKVVEYALQFEGNPYVWGGTSLTNGADCSGFTQSVFRDKGISIPRTSRSQATGGRRVSIDNMQPGDLIFYEKNGTINHVALYIGNGKVISASSPSTGIRVRNYDYRQPYKAVSYID
jgi:cell wall-associated NlpC family hydrolase/SH3-like domain-containing protein